MTNSIHLKNQCIDSLVQKLQSGVVVHFEKFGPDPPPLPGMLPSIASCMLDN